MTLERFIQNFGVLVIAALFCGVIFFASASNKSDERSRSDEQAQGQRGSGHIFGFFVAHRYLYGR